MATMEAASIEDEKLAASIRDAEKTLAAAIGDEDELADRMNGVESDERS